MMEHMFRGYGQNEIRPSLGKFTFFQLAVARSIPRFAGDRVRAHFVDSLPFDPLASFEPAPIEVFIPSSPRDLDVAGAAISGAMKYITNPIEKIVIATPNPSEFRDLSTNALTHISSDEEVLGESLLSEILRVSKRWEDRIPGGWFVQQALKIEFARKSKSAGVLVIDSDTVLIRPRNFLDTRGIQILSPSYELHSPYVDHFKSYFKLPHRESKLSFVTHHQLLQPSIVREMFPNSEAVLRWCSSGDDNSHSSPVSEYHSYGEYLNVMFPEQRVLSSFRNAPMPRSEIHKLYTFKEQELGSISFHGYVT